MHTGRKGSDPHAAGATGSRPTWDLGPMQHRIPGPSRFEKAGRGVSAAGLPRELLLSPSLAMEDRGFWRGRADSGAMAHRIRPGQAGSMTLATSLAPTFSRA